jgi:hypothetical protein
MQVIARDIREATRHTWQSAYRSSALASTAAVDGSDEGSVNPKFADGDVLEALVAKGRRCHARLQWLLSGRWRRLLSIRSVRTLTQAEMLLATRVAAVLQSEMGRSEQCTAEIRRQDWWVPTPLSI